MAAALAVTSIVAVDLAVHYSQAAYHNVHVHSIITWLYRQDNTQNAAESLCLQQKTVTNFQTGPDKAHINMYLRCQQLVRNLIQVFLGLITGALVVVAAVMKTKAVRHTYRQDIQGQPEHRVQVFVTKQDVVDTV